MAYSHMDDMLWFGGRWWWFPGARIDVDSEFEWRDNRVFLMKPYGSTIEGILFMGEVATD